MNERLALGKDNHSTLIVKGGKCCTWVSHEVHAILF